MSGLHDVRKLHRKHANTSDKVYSVKHLFTEPEFISSDIARHTAKKIRNRTLTLELRSYLKAMKMTLGLRKCETIEVKKYNTATTEISAFFR